MTTIKYESTRCDNVTDTYETLKSIKAIIDEFVDFVEGERQITIPHKGYKLITGYERNHGELVSPEQSKNFYLAVDEILSLTETLKENKKVFDSPVKYTVEKYEHPSPIESEINSKMREHLNREINNPMEYLKPTTPTIKV